MNQEDRQELSRLAEISKDEIGINENSVKVNFIIPFLKSFGYKNPEFEHAAQGMRIDILIKSSENKILIEAKGADKSIDDYVGQLKKYCDEKRPILAIITNGEEIRFYSPFWRKPNFNDTLIFSITRQQLSDNSTVDNIERILIKDGNITEHIEDREKAISNIRKDIKSLESKYQNNIAILDSEINNLEKQYEDIRLHIDRKRTELLDIKREKDKEIIQLKKDNLIYLSDPIEFTLPNSPEMLRNIESKKNSKKAKGKPGVIKAIIGALKNGPITKESILKQLINNFPDRPSEGMKKTINIQVPSRLVKEGFKVKNKDDAYWI